MNNRWIAYHKTNPAHQLRLFCFPYAGGGASIFRSWAAELPATVEVYPVQLPGRENRLNEPPFVQITALVEALGSALLPFISETFAFFGHSLGALVAFELARYLRRQEYPQPKHIFVSARQAPQLPGARPRICHLPDREFLRGIQRLNGTPTTVLQNEELMRVFLPLLRADVSLNENYRYISEAPLNSPISAFGGLQDIDISKQALAAWQEQTQASFKLRMLPNDHFFLQTERKLLLQAIVQDIQAS